MSTYHGDRIVQRIHAEGTWRSSSALHLGGESSDLEHNVDMALLRDANGGHYVPGASIAGAGRSYLRRYSGDTAALNCLFGARHVKNAKNVYASLVTVSDAKQVSKNKLNTFVRDGVRINPKDGLAVAGGKYNMEVLPAGTEFRFQFDLVLYEKLPGDIDKQRVLQQFRALLEALQLGHVRLGARTRKGFGEGKVDEWCIRRLFMDSKHPPHVIAWLKREPCKGETVALDRLSEDKPPIKDPALKITAALQLKTSLLIRSSGEDPRAPDMVHLCENGQPLLTGTSFGGALRGRCTRIANTLAIANKLPPDMAAHRIEGLFGSPPDSNDKEKKAGRIWITERKLDHGGLSVQGRVQIDRFTGGARDAALFDEAPFWPESNGEHWKIEIVLDRGASAGDKGLLLLAFRDLWLGDLAVGGEESVGRGVFQGLWATIADESGHSVEMRRTEGDPDPARVTVTGDLQSKLDDYVKAITVPENKT